MSKENFNIKVNSCDETSCKYTMQNTTSKKYYVKSYPVRRSRGVEGGVQGELPSL